MEIKKCLMAGEFWTCSLTWSIGCRLFPCRSVLGCSPLSLGHSTQALQSASTESQTMCFLPRTNTHRHTETHKLTHTDTVAQKKRFGHPVLAARQGSKSRAVTAVRDSTTAALGRKTWKEWAVSASDLDLFKEDEKAHPDQEQDRGTIGRRTIWRSPAFDYYYYHYAYRKCAFLVHINYENVANALPY